MSFRRLDFLLLAALLCVCGILFLLPKSSGTEVEIISDGKLIGTYPLNVDRVIPVDGENGTNTVVIEDGKVSVAQADCPGGDCICHAPISKGGESIACLPNSLLVRITSADAPDAVTGGNEK